MLQFHNEVFTSNHNDERLKFPYQRDNVSESLINLLCVCVLMMHYDVLSVAYNTSDETDFAVYR